MKDFQPFTAFVPWIIHSEALTESQYGGVESGEWCGKCLILLHLLLQMGQRPLKKKLFSKKNAENNIILQLYLNERSTFVYAKPNQRIKH